MTHQASCPKALASAIAWLRNENESLRGELIEAQNDLKGTTKRLRSANKRLRAIGQAVSGVAALAHPVKKQVRR